MASFLFIVASTSDFPKTALALHEVGLSREGKDSLVSQQTCEKAQTLEWA